MIRNKIVSLSLTGYPVIIVHCLDSDPSKAGMEHAELIINRFLLRREMPYERIVPYRIVPSLLEKTVSEIKKNDYWGKEATLKEIFRIINQLPSNSPYLLLTSKPVAKFLLHNSPPDVYSHVSVLQNNDDANAIIAATVTYIVNGS
ncbi:MAG: hypothetical protein WCH76_01905 [Candidatus Riflemargulisbacteria bacterium]